jgi:TolA-binding protein
MCRKFSILSVIIAFLSIHAFAQQSAWFELDKHYKSGLELLENGKYAAASNQFSSVIKNYRRSSTNAETNPEIGLLRENSHYFIALCALELGNSNAESLFLDFINTYTGNNYTKLAFYHVGRYYFKQKNYPKVIEWLKKIEDNNLSGKESFEYRYKLAYSYFEIKDYNQAKSIFYQLLERTYTRTYSILFSIEQMPFFCRAVEIPKKSVEQSRFEQMDFEQLTPTPKFLDLYASIYGTHIILNN